MAFPPFGHPYGSASQVSSALLGGRGTGAGEMSGARSDSLTFLFSVTQGKPGARVEKSATHPLTFECFHS